jgi:hypothetical protein
MGPKKDSDGSKAKRKVVVVSVFKQIAFRTAFRNEFCSATEVLLYYHFGLHSMSLLNFYFSSLFPEILSVLTTRKWFGVTADVCDTLHLYASCVLYLLKCD